MLGDSIMHWAGEYAAEHNQLNLGLQLQIGWMGYRGMSWSQFKHIMQLQVTFATPPKIIFIHLGGNDVETLTMCKIFNRIRSGIRYLRAAFDTCKIVWVVILPRTAWRCRSALEDKPKRLNRHGRHMAQSVGGYCLALDIDGQTEGFYRKDGVHLSKVGQAMFLDAIKEKILDLF